MKCHFMAVYLIKFNEMHVSSHEQVFSTFSNTTLARPYEFAINKLYIVFSPSVNYLQTHVIWG